MIKTKVLPCDVSKGLRKKLDLSQEQFALLLKISPRTISRCEAQSTKTNPKLLARLTKLNKLVDNLLGRDLSRNEILVFLMSHGETEVNLSAVVFEESFR